jgi:hypothetical protein
MGGQARHLAVVAKRRFYNAKGGFTRLAKVVSFSVSAERFSFDRNEDVDLQFRER